MAEEEGDQSTMNQRLIALQCWLFDFPQLIAHRQGQQQQQEEDDEEDGISNNGNSKHNIDYSSLEFAIIVIDIVKEILSCCNNDNTAGRDNDDEGGQCPASAGEAWVIIQNMIRENADADDGLVLNTDEEKKMMNDESLYNILRALLCYAISDKCAKQREYVRRIMQSGRDDVTRELMTIIQEHSHNSNNNSNNNSSDVEETGDYSVFMEASAAGSLCETFDAYESDVDNTNSSSTVKRDRSEAFGRSNNDENEEGKKDNTNSPQGKRHHHDDTEDDDSDMLLEESVLEPRQLEVTADPSEVINLRATIAKSQQELKESRQQEIDLAVKVDEEQSQHRAEMLQLESKHLRAIRDMEEKYNIEISDQTKELDNLRDCEQSAKAFKEENLRLRDELDVLQCSKEKLSYTEEQLRKCRDRIEQIGDAHDALQREEKAHATSVDKCLSLENELSKLKPLKRQLEENRIRATDAEVALAECRDDLRRVKEKSHGLEGSNKALRGAADMHHGEAMNMQKRLQEEGGKSDRDGTAVGTGMR